MRTNLDFSPFRSRVGFGRTLAQQIASLLLASICLLAFVSPLQANDSPWSWQEVVQATTNAKLPSASLASAPPAPVSVISINLDPKTIKVPGVLANVWPGFKDLLDKLRKVVMDDPTLKASLEGQGVRASSVVGVGEAPDGHVTVFVSNAA